jgi:hypothetical protein
MEASLPPQTRQWISCSNQCHHTFEKDPGESFPQIRCKLRLSEFLIFEWRRMPSRSDLLRFIVSKMEVEQCQKVDDG